MDEAKRVGREKLGQARDAARDMMDETLHQGRQALEGQRHAAAAQIHGVASALRAAADRFSEQNQGYMAEFADRAADGLDDMSDTVDHHEIGELMHRLQDFTRRQPALVLGGAVATGLILARFFAASGRRAQEHEWHEERWPEERLSEPPVAAVAGGTAAPMRPEETGTGPSVPVGTPSPTAGIGEGRSEEEIR